MHEYWTISLASLILTVQICALDFTESRPYTLNPTLPFCDRLTPDLFYYHVALKNENDTQETQMK